MAGEYSNLLTYGLPTLLILIVLCIIFILLREPRKPKPPRDVVCPVCKNLLDWASEADRWYCKVCVRWYSISEYDKVESMEKRVPLPSSPSLPAKEVKEPKIYQFICKNCGKSFWIYEHRLKIPYCKECGAPNPSHILSIQKQERVRVDYKSSIFSMMAGLRKKITKTEAIPTPQPIPLPPPPDGMIKKVEQQKPPPPSEYSKYKSQFHCNACERSFWIYEHRLKIPYCQECGAPDPVHVVTVEHIGN